jgi:hypothetical protein
MKPRSGCARVWLITASSNSGAERNIIEGVLVHATCFEVIVPLVTAMFICKSNEIAFAVMSSS